MKFDDVIYLLKRGDKLTRKCTNRGFQFIYLVPGSEFVVNRAPLLGIYDEGTTIKYRPHIDAAYQDGTCGVWSPTQDDILAQDWEVVS